MQENKITFFRFIFPFTLQTPVMKKLSLLYLLCTFFYFAQAQLVADINVKFAGADLVNNVSIANLGSVELRQTGPSEVFTIENLGDTPLNLAGGALKVWKSGSDWDSFIIDQTGLGEELAPGASATFSVQFKPFTMGDKTIIITIHNNDPAESPFKFELRGKGVSADINVRHDEVDLVHNTSVVNLGTVVVGQPAPAQTFIIDNKGEVALNLSGSPKVFVSGQNPADFIVTQTN